MNNRFTLSASAASADGDVLEAQFSNTIVRSDKQAPESIQWMPPGVHRIVAVGPGNQPIEVTMTVDASTAATVQASFLKLKAAADAGHGDEPFFDFRHDDQEASAHPTEFYWAGDDPKEGGVRAKVAWTDLGAAAVLGKRYRRFSPRFREMGGRVTSLPVNAGGLVNQAAFQRIAPLAAKRPDASENPTKEGTNTMKTLMAQLAKLGLVTSADASEADAVSQVISAHLAICKERDDAKAALNGATTQRDTLQARAESAEKDLKAHRKSTAEAIVANAIKEGRIPPQNKELEARWIALVEADPKNAELLPAAPTALDDKSVIQAKAGDEKNKEGKDKEEPRGIARIERGLKAQAAGANK